MGRTRSGISVNGCLMFGTDRRAYFRIAPMFMGTSSQHKLLLPGEWVNMGHVIVSHKNDKSVSIICGSVSGF